MIKNLKTIIEEIEKITSITNEMLSGEIYESVTLGAFLKMLKEYKKLEIDRKTFFNILKELNFFRLG